MDEKLTMEGLEGKILEIVGQNPGISGPRLFHTLTLLEKTKEKPVGVEEKNGKSFYKGHEVHISCECRGPTYHIASITLTKELRELLEKHSFKSKGYELNQGAIYALEDYIDTIMAQGKLKIEYKHFSPEDDNKPGCEVPTYTI